MWRLQAEPNDDAKQLDQDLDEGKSTKRIGTKGDAALYQIMLLLFFGGYLLFKHLCGNEIDTGNFLKCRFL